MCLRPHTQSFQRRGHREGPATFLCPPTTPATPVGDGGLSPLSPMATKSYQSAWSIVGAS